MSFLNFSMCPNGAFMTNESVSEYDPVAQDIENMRQTTTYDVKELESLKYPTSESYDPVTDVQSQFSDIYTNYIEVLLRTNYSPDNREAAVELISKVSKIATHISNKIREYIVTQKALIDYYNNPYIVNSSYIINAGTIIANASFFKQQGYSEYEYQTAYLAAFNNFNNPYTTIKRASANMSIYDNIISIDTINSVSHNHEVFNGVFSDTFDMLKCLYNDHDRFQRIQRTENHAISLDSLLQITIDDRDLYYQSCDIADFIQLISKLLKSICNTSYKLQCDLLDDTGENYNITDKFNNDIKTIITRTINIFIISTIILFTNAYTLKHVLNCKSAITEYINSLLTHLKTQK